MLKNYNQITLPSGGALIIFGILLAIFSSLAGININPQWISICIVGGFGLVLASINYLLTQVSGLVLVAVALIILGFAVT